MSNWLRWIGNTTANFNLSNSIRSASGRFMVRSSEQLCKESDESNERIESNKPNKSNEYHPCACHPTRTCDCANNDCSDRDDDIPSHSADCSCSLCTDYAEYVRATKGENASARVWPSNEPRFIKQANADATSSVEYRTGIPTGVTI